MKPRMSMITLGVDDLKRSIEFYKNGLGFNSFAIAHNVSSEAEVISVINQAVQAGAILVKEPQKVFWGGFSGYFKDLDGHLWEIAFNPYTWIGPSDEAGP